MLSEGVILKACYLDKFIYYLLFIFCFCLVLFLLLAMNDIKISTVSDLFLLIEIFFK